MQGLKRLVHFAAIIAWLGASLVAGLTDFGRVPPPAYAYPPVASVSAGVPGTVLIGNNFSFSLTFANTAILPTDVGYGPFIDIVFPRNGADGAAGTSTPDGIDFISATYLGQAVTAVVQTFPDDDGAGAGATGTLNHPYAVNTSNQPLTVTGTAGDRLVTLQLPFGSFVPGQTPIDITVNASLSNLADLGTALTLRYRGGYMFGATPLNDWCCDPVILSSPLPNSATWPPASTTPNLFTFSKDNPMHESETATGPNYPWTYNLAVDVPAGQQVTNVRITDTMPNNAAFITGTVTAAPGGFSLVDQPLTPGAQNPPNNDLIVNWPGPITGAAGNDATANFQFFIPYTNASGIAIVNPVTGACANSTNTAQSSVNWTPIDVRDGPTPIGASAAGPTVAACGLVGQKGGAVITDTGAAGPTPGDIVRYTLDFQVSDFLAFNTLVITDTLGDGLRFRATTAPTLQINGNSFTLSAAAMNAANFTVIDHWTGAPVPVPPITGTTDIVFRVSNELVTRGQPNGNVLGGCVPTTGATTPDCSAFNDAATTGQIIFEAVILDQFTDNFPSGDQSVDHGDILSNALLTSGAVLTTTAGFAPTGFSPTNSSGSSLTVAFGNLTKSIYAIGGNTAFTSTQVSPGVTVTYRLRYTMPSSDFENTRITDYLPLPIFRATEVTTFTTPITGAAVPPAGTFKFGPADSIFSTFGFVPTLTVDSTANTVSFNYGTFDDPLNRNTEIDLLFTVTASNEPFADRLFLTNQVNVSEGTTNAGSQTVNAIVQVQLTQPVLRFGKAVIASDNAGAIFNPPTVGPVAFNAPGTPGVRWAGVINSSNMITNPINSNVTGVDAGDRMSFALIIENAGTSPNGAFDIGITDTLPAGFVIPVGGLNLRVSLGDGTNVNFVGLGGGPDALPNTPDDLFGVGIQLVDNPTTGICQAHNLTNGLNVVVITYDLEIDSNVAPNQPIINTGLLGSYAGSEGGPNHITTPLTDTASVTIRSLPLGKALIGTELNNAVNSASQVVIGELITYTLTLTVPEGIMPGVLITDTLDSGLAFVDVITTSTSPSLTLSGSFTPTVLPGGQTVTFNLGTITNTNRSNAAAELVTITYRAVALDVLGNQAGTLLNNSALLGWTANVTGPVSAPNATVIEPAIDAAKSVTPTVVDAGDPVTYTITLRHAVTSTTDAFEVTFTDPIPAEIVSPGFTMIDSAGLLTAADFSLVGSTLQSNAPFDFLYSTTRALTFTVTGTITNAVTPSMLITNTATTQWTSLDSTPGVRSTFNISSTERTGAGGVDDYRDTGVIALTVLQPQPIKSIVATSESHTGVLGGAQRVAVGEIIRYRTVITLAEGTSPNFQIVDNLPNGLTFLNDGTTTVAFICNEGSPCMTSSTLGTSPVITGSSVTTPTFALPGGAITGAPFNTGTDPTFSLGTLNNNDSDADAELVVLEFNALVDNSAGGSNDSGDTRNNSFTVRVNGVNIATSPNVGAVVAEPVLALSKSVVPPLPVDAGDLVTYTLNVTNTSTGNNRAAAYDVVITDVLNSNLTLVSMVSSTTSIAGVNNCGATTPAFGSVTAGQALTVTLTCLSPNNAFAVVTLTAQVANTALNGISIPNSGRLVYSSLPVTGTLGNPTGSTVPTGSGTPTGERNGSGGLNDHFVNSNVVTVTLATPTLDKLTPSPAGYAIGDLVTYTIQITVPEGVAQNLIVTDTLPSGMTFVSSQVIVSAAASGGALAADYNGTVTASPVVTDTGSAVLFDFGSVTTTADNVGSNNRFLLRLTASVNNVIGNQAGTTLVNSASLRFTNGGAPIPITDTTPVTVTVLEPSLTLTKTILSLPSPADAGGIVTYRVGFVNATGATVSPAYDVVLTDTLPFQLTLLTPITVTLSGGASGVTDNSTSSLVNLTVGVIPAGGGVIVDYAAVISTSVTPGEIIANAAEATYTSQGGPTSGERTGTGGINDYRTPVSTVNFTTTTPSLSKAIVSTSAAHTAGSNVAVGEIVTYALTVTLPEGTTPSLVVTDVLPLGLAFVSGSASLDTTGFNGAINVADPIVTSAGGDGDDVVFTFNNAVTVVADNNAANDRFSLRLQARVLNVAGNQDAVSLANSAALQVGSFTTSTTPVNVTVVEPVLAPTKSVNDATPAYGQTLTYTITVAHSGASTADALDVVLTDTIPAGLSYVLGSASVPGGSVNEAGNPAIVFSLPALAVGNSVNITYQATVASPPTVNAGDLLTNNVTVRWTSLAGSDSGERTGTGGINDYIATTAQTVTVSGVDLQIFKNDGGATALPGGLVVYTITYTNTGNVAASNVVITDIVPANTTFNPVLSNPTWQFTSVTAGSVITANVGTVAGGGANGAITFTVNVDAPLGTGVTVLSNAVRVGDDGTNGPEPTPTDNVFTETTPVSATVDLQIFKNDGGATALPGGLVVYTITYTNTGNIAASNVVLTDIVPANTTFNPVLSNPTWQFTSVTAGSAITANVGTVAGGGANGAITFTVNVDAPLGTGVTVLSNAVQVGDDGTNGPEPTPTDNVFTETTPVAATIDLRLSKAANVATVSAGSLLTYTLNYTNVGSITSTGVVITEVVPLNTVFNAGASAPFVWSCADGSPAGATCLLPVGTLAGNGGSGLARFGVQLDNPLAPSVTAITNTASIGDDGVNGTDPTPINNSSSAASPISPPTAVTLLYFRVESASGAQVVLQWATAAEVDNFGFYIYRASVNDFAQADAIGFVPSAIPGGKGAGTTYQYADTQPGAGTVWYWLVDVDTSGAETPHGPVQAIITQVIGPYRLYLPLIGR